MRVSDRQIEHLRRHGYVLVPGFLTAEELASAREGFLRYYPSWEELVEKPERYGGLIDDAEALQTEFPFTVHALNHISTHPQIIALVEALLGTSEVLLSQSAIWAKYAGAADYEQGLHLDYQGNTLVVPRDDGDYRQVNIILYYSDVSAELGPTCVVSQEQTRREPLWPPFRPRAKHAALYRKEKKILAKAGSLLVFSMRTFHRASEITAEAGARFSHHLVYRAARHTFQGYHLYAHEGERPELSAFIQRATPRQREVLGFPRPGDPYWTKETLVAVARRYPRMDLSAYRATS
jgi:ectoine hydroxylase-related dioxygenase (phytanoyl-CoA dioxygenase family)